MDLDQVHRLTSHAVSILLLHHIEAYLYRIAPGLKDGTIKVASLIELVHKHPPTEEDRLTKVVDHGYLPGWIRQVQRAVTVCSVKGRKAKDDLNDAELAVLKPLQLEIGILSSLPLFSLALLLILFLGSCCACGETLEEVPTMWQYHEQNCPLAKTPAAASPAPAVPAPAPPAAPARSLVEILNDASARADKILSSDVAQPKQQKISKHEKKKAQQAELAQAWERQQGAE